jgi:hypothetical protein
LESEADAVAEVTEDLVHIRVGTIESGWYTTACGKASGDYRIVIYKGRHLATCKECREVFEAKESKAESKS